jgi:succinate dehydrogenase flavin-adding protein (antitoxin of CptAB toxin-antitoxin module)
MNFQKIIISAELKDLLKEIGDSLFAQLLLKEEHPVEDLVDDFVNFISISKKDRTKISYLPKERSEGLSLEECFSTSKRIMAKPGGFISKVFKNISEKEVEKFSTLFRSEATKPQLDFEVVQGEFIKDYYHYSKYAERNGGSLHASCMKHNSCQNFLDIYSLNTEVCKMVLLFDNDEFSEGDYYDETKIVGRALLWNFDGYKLMDRIYTINDETYQFYFKQWATKNGYLFKTQQNWFNTKFFERLGDKKQKLELKLDLKNKSFDYVPYMDTFKFMDYDGVLYNYQPEGKNYYTLTDTGGRKNGYDHLVTDFLDDVLRYRGDAIRLSYLGENKWTHPDNCRYSDVMDRYILKDHCVKEPNLNDWIFNEEYSSNNDDERIRDRIEWIKQREEERSQRRSSKRVSSVDRHSSIQDYLNSLIEGGFNIHTMSDFRSVGTTEQTEEPIPSTESEPVVNGAIDFEIDFYSIPQPTRTDTMRDETTMADQSQSRRVRYRSRPRLDENYLSSLYLQYVRNPQSESEFSVVEHIRNYINYEYCDSIGSYGLPDSFVGYVSERVAYTYLRGRIGSIREIIDMIEVNFNDEISRHRDRFTWMPEQSQPDNNLPF